MLTVGEAVSNCCGLARNMILARLLTKSDFGVAATFTIVITLLEFSARCGVGFFVVRDQEADTPGFLATVHLAQFAVSFMSAMVIALTAWPMSGLLGIREQMGWLFLVATLPLIHGLGHLDVRRYERDLRFAPSVVVEAGPQIVTLALAWPVGRWLGDYRALLMLLMAKAVLSLIGTHLLASQPYRWRMVRTVVRRFVGFAWPLVLTGFFFFVMVRGDQFVVATFFSKADLGAYAAAASITVVPTLFFGRALSPVILPIMAKCQDNPAMFAKRYDLAMAMCCAFGAMYAIAVMIAAEPIMRLAFGQKYVGAGAILAWLTAANAIRCSRSATSTAALAKGDSRNEMLSSFAGGAGLLAAVVAAVARQPLWVVAAVGVVGQLLACGVSFWRLRRRDGVPLGRSLVPASLVVLATALGGAVCLFLRHGRLHGVWLIPMAGVGGLVYAAGVIALRAESRREVKLMWRRYGSRQPNGSPAAQVLTGSDPNAE